jgi:phosphoserine phosphatase RsbU/P
MSNLIQSKKSNLKSHSLIDSMIQFSRRFRLRTTLVLPFVLQIVTAVGLVGYLSFRNGQKAINDLASQLRNEVTARVRDRIKNYLEVPQQLNQLNAQMLELGLLDFEKISEAQRYFWRQVQTYETISHIGFANREGQYARVGWINRISTAHPSQKVEQPQIAQQLLPGGGNLNYYNIDEDGNPTTLIKTVKNWDIRNRPSYQTALKKGKQTWTNLYTNVGYDALQIYAVKPFYDRDNQLFAVLSCSLGPDQISDFLQTLKIGRTGEVFILEPSGDLVATSVKNQPVLRGTSKDTNRRVQAIDSIDTLLHSSAKFLTARFPKLTDIDTDEQLEFILNGQRHFVQVSPFRDKYGLSWLIVVVVPEADFMEQINANTRTTIILCIGAFGVAIVFGIFTASIITNPIIRITETSKQIASGNLDKRVDMRDVIEIDEIKTLETSFNSMAEQLKDSIETLEYKVKERTSELAKANQEISGLNEQLKEENLRMGAELNVARKLQHMILPKPEELDNIKELDIAGFMEPADEVGGDYYDILDRDGVITIGIGDVTGHGLESGILMLMTQTAIRTLKEVQENDPVKFLDTLNRTIYNNIQRMNSQRNLTLAILNYSQGILSISGQHEEILIVRNGGEIERVDTIDLGFPIGLEYDIFDFISHVLVELQPGDGVVLYTDGITEAEDMKNKQYGIEQLCHIISENWEKSVQEIKDIIITDVQRHIDQQKVFDDITLLVLKRPRYLS